MMIRAYDEMYLDSAQNILGHAVDFAVMSLEIEPELFGSALSVSKSAKQFAEGNPLYTAGMSGCEFAKAVLDDINLPYPDIEDVMYLDKSPEYWAGWALAYYQWFTGYSFIEILSAVSLPELIQMYSLYHEMDISRFTEQLNLKMKQKNPNTRLWKHRKNCGFSQAELAAASNVPLRQIQLFEQRQRDINNTSAISLYKLSKALHCEMEDLIEIQ